MYREIIIPTGTKQTIEFHEEFVGKQVEVIAFPLEEKKGVSLKLNKPSISGENTA